MAITRRQHKEISPQHSRHLRSRAVPHTAKWTPFQPPQNRRESGRQQSQAVEINPEDVGVPEDGKWKLIAAHESRFCFQHGEDEWLLESENKWMDPGDFNIPRAEAVLDAKLQKYNSKPWDLNRRLLSKQNAMAVFGLISTPPYREANLGTRPSI
jgi:hypothetical protein